jgi:hypothetical protein
MSYAVLLLITITLILRLFNFILELIIIVRATFILAQLKFTLRLEFFVTNLVQFI